MVYEIIDNTSMNNDTIKGFLLSLVFILPINSCTVNQQEPATDISPNILLITSDNQYSRHLGSYGDPVVKTPNIDRLAENGVLFTHAFASPSCTPARSALLAGKNIWRLGEAANLWSTFADTIPTYVDLIEEAGYTVGHSRKGWGPGNYEAGGRTRNPAGETFENFGEFLDQKRSDSPWSFWLCSRDPHRPFIFGAGIESGMDLEKIEVPPYLPDVPEVRSDIADYYYQVQQFDQQVADAVALLEEYGLMEHTIIIVTSDNGWQMPRGLANLYDFGTHVPLIVSWPEKFIPGRKVDDMVRLKDLAPTILQLANVSVPEDYNARSLLPILESDKDGRVMKDRNEVYNARERHALARQGGLSYPGRSIRTHDYLYIWNMEPDRWPAGDPPLFGDIDAHMLHYVSPTKEFMMEHKDEPDIKPLYELAFLKRPEVELFDLQKDPYQMHNVADDPDYQHVRKELEDKLITYLRDTGDPRVTGGEIIWDDQPYYLERDWNPTPRIEAQEKFGLKPEYRY